VLLQDSAFGKRRAQMDTEQQRLLDDMHERIVDETRRLLADKQRAIAEEIGRLRVGQARREAFNERLSNQVAVIKEKEVCVLCE
jgi:hypothetical protein